MNTTKSFIETFLLSVRNFPDHAALWVDNRYYTYSTLYEMALKTAGVLQDFPNSRCVILSNRNITAYTAILAALMADKTYVPLNITLPLSVNLNLIARADTNLVIIDQISSDYAKQLINATNNSLQMITLNMQSSLKKQIVYNNNAAYLLFTSGSTGVPKGVLVSHANALTYVRNMIARSQPCETDRFSQLAELTFDFSVHDLFVAWSVGACVYSIASKHFVHWQQFMDQHRLTFWASVPSAIYFLKQTNQISSESMKSLRYSVFCGEILPQALAEEWKAAAPHSTIDNLYGPTEASVACIGHVWQPDSDYQKGIPIGFPFPDQHIMIMNEKNESASSGELCLSGPQVVTSYWRDAELTRQRFFTLPNDDRLWYRTGDFVRWDKNMGLIYQGRLDDQFKIRGRCVTKIEIEHALQRIANTTHVAVVPIFFEGTQFVQHIIAFVCDSKNTPEEILKNARLTLPDYMVPSRIIELSSLPLNKNGKTDYLKLRTAGDYEFQTL